MENTLQLRKRAFAIVTTVAMVLGSLSAVLVPQTAAAASGGDLIMGESLSTLYYYGYDGSRYTFPNEKTYMTWYSDFSDIEEISDSELADISLAGNVVYRPGSYWIKITSAAETYAVSTDGMIHWIESEDVATDYAGDDWNEGIHDVPDVFFVDYEDGASLTTATAYDGLAYMDGGDYYLSWGGEMRMMSEDGRDANRYWDWMFLDGEGIDDSSLSAGDDIDAAICDLTDVAQTGGCDDEGSAGGDIEISLSSSTPAGATLPLGANSVEVFSFDVEAGDEDAELESVTLSLSSVGATTNVSNVYLYEGSSRLTEARSVNASTRQVTFGSLDFEIDAGDTHTLTARIEVSSSGSAGDEIAFSIEEADDVEASGDVDGDFEIEGETFELASSSAGTLTVTKNGTITNPTLGESEAVVGKFKVAASTEDAEIEMMTLKIDNSGDHSDFMLWADGEEVAEGEYIGDKLVMFDLSDDPYEITDGNSEIFEVSLTAGGDASDAVKVYFDNAVDLFAVGGDFGFGMVADIATSGTYDGTSCTSSAGNCSYSTIQGGEVTFALNGPSAGEVQTNAQDEVLLEFSLTAAQEITVKDLDIIVYGDDDADSDPFDAGDGSDDDDDGLINTNGEGNLSDIKLVNAETGSSVMGPLELDCVTTTCGADGTNDASQTIDFSDDFGMDAGETLTLQLTADIDNNATSGTEFGATIDISGFSAEDANGDSLTLADDVVPTSDIQGYAQEALSASLTVSLGATPGDVTTVQGMDDVHVNSFNFVGGDAGDVLITSIVVDVFADDDGTGTFTEGDVSGADVNDYIESCTLYDNEGSLLDGPESPATGGATITFSEVDWTIEASENEVLDIYCNIANPSDTDADYFAFDLDDLSEVITAQDEDGTDVDPTTDSPNGDTSPTNVVTINEAGTLSMTVDSGTPSADFVMTGSTDNHVTSVRFSATNEDFEIQTVTFSEEQAEDDTNSTDSSAYNNNIELVTMVYEAEDGSEATSTATMNGNEAKFSLAGDDDEPYLYVANSENVVVDIYVDVPETDRASGGSATSNEDIRMGLFVDTSNDDNFKAVGVGSGVTKDDDDASVLGDDSGDGIKTFVVKETQPTITLSSSSPGGSGFVPGDQEVLRFNVAASGNEDVILKEMIFDFSATDNDAEGTTDNQPDWNECDSDVTDGTFGMWAGGLDFYNLSEDGTSSALDVDADWTFLLSSGADCSATQADVEFIQLELTTVETIPAGETYTYSLYLDSTNASASDDDSLQVGIASDPIIAVSSAIATTTLAEGTTSGTDTTISVTSASDINAGDIVCLDVDGASGDGCTSADELLFVAAKSSNDLYVVRQYLNTAYDSGETWNSGADDIDRIPGALSWEDDGTSGVTETTTDQAWGAYLVDDLPVTGNSIQF